MTDLLRLAADLRAEHPRVAGALLFAVAYSAAKLKDCSLKLRYLVYVSLGILRFLKEAQSVRAHPASWRTFMQGQLLFHLSDVWSTPFDAGMLFVMERFFGAIDLHALPEARKKDLMKIYEAMIRDVVAREGDIETVRQAISKVERAYGQRPVSVVAVTIDFMTTALLAVGKVERWSTVSALVESGGHFSAFLHGIPPVQELEGFPNMTEVMKATLTDRAQL